MTDIVPATPSPNGSAAPVLRSRQAVTMPAQAPAQPLGEIERICNMIAAGGEMVPTCYRGKPGAAYLTLMWARKHGVDELTAVQNIVPINGKPFVMSELRREVMEAKGYGVEVIESTSRRCEIEITTPKGKVRRVVAALPDAPEEPGCIFVQPGDEFGINKNWKTRRSDMLYALGIRIADRRIVGSAAAGIDAAQDYIEDPLDVLTTGQGDEDVVDAEVVPDPPPPAASEAQGTVGADERLAELLAKASAAELKEATVLKEANARARAAEQPPVASLHDLAHPVRGELYNDVLDWIEGL